MTETPGVMTGSPSIGLPTAGPDGTDVLSDLLRRFRATGAVLLRGAYTAPWAWEAPDAARIAAHLHAAGTRVVVFHIVALGRCWLDLTGYDRVNLGPGDIVGFPHGDGHRMGWGHGARAFRIIDHFPPAPWREVPTIRRVNGGEACQILCVYLRCDMPLFDPLTAALPRMLLARTGRSASSFADLLVRQLIAEVSAPRLGGACVSARLTELLFLEMVRGQIEPLGPDTIGWLAALRDPHLARALAAIHTAPAQGWTVAEISNRAGLSPSAMRERFSRVLGISPMRYLTLWRLQLAALRLRENGINVPQVAAEVGYAAPEAFARAFKRATGSTPAAWRDTGGLTSQTADRSTTQVPRRSASKRKEH